MTISKETWDKYMRMKKELRKKNLSSEEYEDEIKKIIRKLKI